ncbi:MAG: hypothetical protein JO130_18485 [Solirubrobacterales bacterium]|nr:hypothetical protein [Solirubrobacterales bacterium]
MPDLAVAEIACKRALAKLVTLSDKSAVQIRAEGMLEHETTTDRLRTRDRQPMPVKGGRGAGSQLPSGVDTKATTRGDHAPSKQSSLYFHYRWRMHKALVSEDAGLALSLAGAATQDYEEHVGKRRPLRWASHDDAVNYLLTHYVGVPSATAAVDMRTPSESFRNAQRWVQAQRTRNGHDPELGERRAMDSRTRRIVEMAAAGIKQRLIADEVGLSQAQVSRILSGASIHTQAP